MDLSPTTTFQNLMAAFSGEAMANRKYLFFADVARKLGYTDIAPNYLKKQPNRRLLMLWLTLLCSIQNS